MPARLLSIQMTISKRWAPAKPATTTFTYTLADSSGATDTANVTFTVTGVNDAPNAQNDLFTVPEDAPSGAGSVFTSISGPDSDPEGDTLTVIEVNGNPYTQGTTLNLAGGGDLTFTNVNSGAFSFAPDDYFESLGNGEIRQHHLHLHHQRRQPR